MDCRLLKAHVQATFVIDDGEALTEWIGPVVTISAKDWQRFAADAFSENDCSLVLAKYEASVAQPNGVV